MNNYRINVFKRAALCRNFEQYVFDGINQPSGYTEPILNRRRLEFKLRNN